LRADGSDVAVGLTGFETFASPDYSPRAPMATVDVPLERTRFDQTQRLLCSMGVIGDVRIL
jgi:hypothetical protein